MNQKLTLENLTKNISDNESSSNNDLISLLAITELLNLEKIKTISRIKGEQVPNIAKLYLYHDTFDIPFIKSLADNILQLQISISGLGRKELVQMVQQRFDDQELQPTKKGIFK